MAASKTIMCKKNVHSRFYSALRRQNGTKYIQTVAAAAAKKKKKTFSFLLLGELFIVYE